MANKIGPSIASIDIDKPIDAVKSGKLLQKMLDAYEKRKSVSQADDNVKAG